MRSMLFAALFALATTVTSSAQAAVCFTDVRSWENVKTQLPAFMQTGEFYATHESSMMIGAFAVQQAGSQFRLEGHGRHVLAGTFHESDVIKEACVDGSTIKVTLTKSPTETITQVDGGLKIRGYKFGFTNKAGYEAMVSRVPRFLPEMPAGEFLDFIEVK
jgi:hypothetical protein